MSAAPTVLVADADGPSRRLVRAVLEPHGYGVREASDAADAEARAVEHRPALVLLDLRLPGLDPFEALATLRAHPLTTNVPVVATTASDVAGEVERCRAAGFVNVPVKPIDATELPGRVRRWIAAAGRAGTARG